jgi:hypothetical protein
MVEKFHLALGGWITTQITDAPSLIGAVIKYDTLKRDLGNLGRIGVDSVTWKGTPLPTSRRQTTLPVFSLAYKRGTGGQVARRHEDFEIYPGAMLSHVLFITGIPERKMRTVQITAKAYLAAQDDGSQDKVKYVVAIPPGETTFTDDWFTTADPAVRTMTFDKFIADWKPAVAPSAARGATRYPLFEDLARTIAELKSEKVIYYLTHYERPNVAMGSDFVRTVIGTAPLVLLKSTQKAHVLTKRLPQAVDLLPVLEKQAEAILDSVTQNDLDAMDADAVLRSVDTNMMSFLRKVQADITHKGILAVIDQYDRAQTLAGTTRDRVFQIRSALRRTVRSQDTLGHSTWDTSLWRTTIDKLPLLTTYFARDYQRTVLGNAHALAYINMAESLTAATIA